jgi:Uma2 family endonuclease
MATATVPPTRQRPHRFTVEEYYRMAEVGILRPEARVELLDGEVVDMSPINPPHASTVERVRDLLAGRTAGRAQVRGQNPVRLGEHSEPQPDLAVVRPRADYYAAGHPEPADVLLLVEVADSTLGEDRRRKLPLYARAGVAEVWLLDLQARRLEVYREPEPGGYAQTPTYQPQQRVAPAAFPDVVLHVTELLPPAESDRDRAPEPPAGRAADRARERGWDLER